MKILIIDDKPSELKRAATAAEHQKGIKFTLFNPRKGGRIIPVKVEPGIPCLQVASPETWIEAMENADAVVTDLFWRPFYIKGDEPPSGLLVAIHGLVVKKPVVICTDAQGDPKGHHGKAVSWIYDGYLKALGYTTKAPFGFVDNKDWSRAIERVIHRLKTF